uniref:Protection of telomeres protein 1 ssDNA-binding domain-containing protein n=1 Tax=Cyprinus carpio TaxID=7962 RepID=A0A8C1QJF2_CYPCA
LTLISFFPQLLPFGCAKYTYVPLNILKPKTLVNVCGLVTFFKQPFPSKGSGHVSQVTFIYIALLTIQIVSNQLNNINLENSNGEKTLGETRLSRGTSSTLARRNQQFQELCQWAANQSWISSDLTVSLSSVQPGKYFDLTCKLLARAIMDSRCILLKVWDGTKCQHPLLNVAVASDTLEEESTVTKDRMNLTVKVLVYKNHLESARDLKVSMFLRFYNLHALLQRAPDQVPDKPEHLCFHLHGGTPDPWSIDH